MSLARQQRKSRLSSILGDARSLCFLALSGCDCQTGAGFGLPCHWVGCHLSKLGWVSGGVPLDTTGKTYFAGANQGSLVIAFRIDLFIDAQQFKHEVDEYVRRVRSLTPLAGFDSSAGGVELHANASTEGIPVGPEHQQRLEGDRPGVGHESPVVINNFYDS